jgi:hypothetical protein
VLLSLRRRGQLLLLTSALLGAVGGASLGMMVEHAETPSAFAAAARERAASGMAASPLSSQSSGSKATAPWSQAGEESTGRRTSVVDRADRHHKAGDGKHDRGTPADRGNGKPGKDK